MVKRAAGFAGLNADFFKSGGRQEGETAYALALGGHLEHTPVGRFSVFGKIGQSYFIDRVDVALSLRLEDKDIAVRAMNTVRELPMILYTPNYHRSTLVGGRIDAVIKGQRVYALYPHGNAPIPEDGFVVSFDPDCWQKYKKSFEVGSVVTLKQSIVSSQGLHWNKSQFMVAGVPMLLIKGEVQNMQRYSDEFSKRSRARTAVGITKKGMLTFVIVEGNDKRDLKVEDLVNDLKEQGMEQSKISKVTLSEAQSYCRKQGSYEGISLGGLAAFMRKLGCVSALNLDGGSSTSLYIHGKVIMQKDPYLSGVLSIS